MNPKLTIGIPVHNGMPYLAETLQSLQGQTFGDFKLLLNAVFLGSSKKL